MINFIIPAKTFLLGEYVALANGPALLLTTQPCFKLSITNRNQTIPLDARSPAALFWQAQSENHVQLDWHDPYQAKGGLGASSAQFLGAYLAYCYLKNLQPNPNELLTFYRQYAWNKKGTPPSGYDLLAQSQHGCVFIHQQQQRYELLTWPFPDLAFILIHTGQKLATHQHLETITLPAQLKTLVQLVELGKTAFTTQNNQLLIDAINGYYQELSALNLVAKHTQALIHDLKKENDLLAAKGCGAMGADVILLIADAPSYPSLYSKLQSKQLTILATHEDLHTKKPLIENNLLKGLEISA